MYSTAIKQTKMVDFGRRSRLKVYPVSIGAMRLPSDDEQAVALMRQAIDAGMIYIDTSLGYGDSEIKVGKSLKGGYRQRVILSTKSSPWNKKTDPPNDSSAERTYRRIIESMERLDVDYLDFYQIWSINNPHHYKEATRTGGMLDGIFHAMNKGLVRHAGFTTHDSPENVSRYIDEADWCEAILFTYNMLDRTYKDVIAKAHEKGIATIVMNPIGGGMLNEGSPMLNEAVKNTLDMDDTVEAAHRYLAGDENVDTILCGISKPSDIVSTIENYCKGSLSVEQRLALEKALVIISKTGMNFCTGCGYCMPCPAGIKIPEMMNVFYLDKMLHVPKKAMEAYNWQMNPDNCEGSKAPSKCVQCGQCEQKCSQKLKIIDNMKYLAEAY